MIALSKLLFLLLFALLVVGIYSCRPDDRLRHPVAFGRVIGYEICQTDSAKQYWLIEMEEEYGDSLRYNNLQYAHAVKTNELLPRCKQVGKRLFLEFEISKNKVKSTNCTIPVPEVYDLRTMKLFLQAIEP